MAMKSARLYPQAGLSARLEARYPKPMTMARQPMQKSPDISALAPGERIEAPFVIVEAKHGQSRNGPYWGLTLQNATGRIEAKMWSPQSLAFEDIPTGRLALVFGQVGSFRDQNQITVERLELVEPADLDLDMAEFVPASQRSPEDMLAEIHELCRAHLVHKPWKDLCRRILADKDIRNRLLAAAGAKTVHHAYLGGLLEHTLSVIRLCMAVCDQYPYLDRQVIFTAALVHDLGKAWELSGELDNEYTDEGRLLGHIVLSLEKIAPFLDKAEDLDPALIMHLKHIVVSHHGEYEFGSPRRPKTPEAFVLHHADNLDAKLNMIRETQGQDQEGAWSAYNRYLERFLYNPRRSPDGQGNKCGQESEKKGGHQCLLPLKA